MEMSIDDSERYLRLMLGGMKHAVEYWKDKDKEESDIEQTNVEAVKTALDIMRKYQQLQSDYENRLKADMVAMLTDIQLDIEEHNMTSGVINQDTWNECIACCSRVIQQKIDAMKGRENESVKK